MTADLELYLRGQYAKCYHRAVFYHGPTGSIHCQDCTAWAETLQSWCDRRYR